MHAQGNVVHVLLHHRNRESPLAIPKRKTGTETSPQEKYRWKFSICKGGSIHQTPVLPRMFGKGPKLWCMAGQRAFTLFLKMSDSFTKSGMRNNSHRQRRMTGKCTSKMWILATNTTFSAQRLKYFPFRNWSDPTAPHSLYRQQRPVFSNVAIRFSYTREKVY